MQVLLIQIDGNLPNIALMRLAAHHRARGDTVELRHTTERLLWDSFDRVYASAIFERSRPKVARLKRHWPNAIVGGTGIDKGIKLEDFGVTTRQQDYSEYPAFKASIGFTQRGCRLKCSFCVVPKKEGSVSEENTIANLWRGPPYPKHLHLLDNDFFGQEHWRDRITEIRDGGFKVCFNQGINVRFINDESASALASVRIFNAAFDRPTIYTAWDNRHDESRVIAGLERLTRAGIKPDQITVYMLVAYDHATKQGRPNLTPDDFYRFDRLKEFGCRPWPMPFVKNIETNGFQRWAVRRIYHNVPWPEFVKARYQPANLADQTVGDIRAPGARQ